MQTKKTEQEDSELSHVSEINRRLFLKLAALLSLPPSALLLSSCDTGKLTSDKIKLPDDLPFGIWRMIKEALANSPDNLKQKADDAVFNKSLNDIFELVKNNIQTRPYVKRVYPFRHAHQVHGGRYSLLRTGVGTAREKAELLKHLIELAGFEAEIVEGKLADEFNNLSRYRLNNTSPFNINLKSETFDDWFEQLGLTPKTIDSNKNTQKESGSDKNFSSGQIAAEISDLLEEHIEDNQPNWKLNSSWVPLVKIKQPTESKQSPQSVKNQSTSDVYLNPNLPDAVLGQHHCSATPKKSQFQGSIPTQKVKIKLLGARLSNPNKTFELLNGEWSIEQLIGNRLIFGFQAKEELAEILMLKLEHLRLFFPYMMVQNSELTTNSESSQNVLGDAINLEGEQISVEGNQIYVNKQPIDQNPFRIDDNYLQRAKHAEKITIRVNSSQYPKIILEAQVLDSKGISIVGLPASIFTLKENNSPAVMSMQRNQTAPIKILFLSDFSSSVPSHLRGPKLASLYRKIVSSVNVNDSDVMFRVAKIQNKKRRSYISYLSDWDRSDLNISESISNASVGQWESSEYIAALTEAVNTSADLVVMITDGDSKQQITSKQRALLSDGCESLLIQLTTEQTNHEHFKTLAALTGGQVFESNQSDKISHAISRRISQLKDISYLFSYYSVENENIETSQQSTNKTNPKKSIKYNQLALKLTTVDAIGNAEYQIPNEKLSPSQGLSGLYLQVQMGKKKVFRTLAGYSLKSRNLKSNPITRQELEHTRNALFGQYQISFEVDSPTASAILIDELDRNLSMEKLHHAMRSNNSEDIMSALKGGFIKYAKYAHALNPAWSPTVDGKHLTFQDGFQIVLHSYQADVDSRYQHQCDLLPFVRWQTVARDNRQAFNLSLRRSLDWALLETKYFDVSTAKLLANKSLAASNYNQMTQLNSLPDWKLLFSRQQRLDRYRIYVTDKQKSLPTYWEVDTSSGTLIGMLPNASGGGRSAAVGARFDRLSDGLDKFTEVLGLLSNVSPAFEAWIELEKAKIEHLKRATMALIEMDGSYTTGYGDLLEEQITGFIEDQVTGAVEDAGAEHIPGFESAQTLNEWHSRGQDLFALFGQEPPGGG